MSIKSKKLDITVAEIEKYKSLYDKWVELEDKGKLILRYSPEWWLNVKNDPMYVFFLWLLENRKEK